MRRVFLFRSIGRVLGPGSVVRDAAYMWTRHRWMVPYGAVAFAALVLLAPVGGIVEWPARIAIGLAGGGVAVLATSEYRVVAQTDRAIVLLKASRIRQVATGFLETLPDDATLLPVEATVLTATWQVGDHRYTVPRSSQQAMARMAAARDAGW